ncbi:MAG: bifunctional 23S rRNA (guanine(2069)-N(7))-methyltransferase RlmK/23S rRNA (guanine(2445)-N(2))-methyltransferase RlmL [Tolumonas sp.]|nr:MAG: bifunctional 23S rRNA (guanine(2069)-N(7))-methyltransferase RlmK/23S rRNA (guanine(2445)-N(2))-methyltransferase RlmL [Tolumonas sp.]
MADFFATCPKGLESILAAELSQLGATDVKETVAGVAFSGELEVAYRACLWSRFASRIALALTSFRADTDLDLYLGCFNVPWETHFSVDQSFAVDFSGASKAINNTQYGALKVKDAIVDRFTKRTGIRPSVDKKIPDARVLVHWKRETVSVSLDLSGPALHQRGYRDETGEAPLKENLAAAVLARSGWQNEPLLDPMCGSGTLLIEAAMQACDMAPGLLRRRFGFEKWLQHQPEIWQTLFAEASVRAKRGHKEALQQPERFVGFDLDNRVLQRAKANANRAGVGDLIRFEQADVMKLNNPWPGSKGFLISNPPYGERLGEFPELLKLYQSLGNALRTQFQGWMVTILSASPELLSCLRLRAEKQYRLFNGALECQLRNYVIAENSVASQKMVAEDFANRLKKNIKALDKWAKQEGIDAYRLYDADLPDYNVAIDRYGEYLVIQEYAPPKTIPEHVARQRLLDLMQATIEVTGVPGKNVILKVRERQKGESQYQKLNAEGQLLEVKEYNAKFLVNLRDYLDTGLFLDHRYTRRMLGQLAKGKDFLNLFSYTGTASVHAGLGGARTTTTVDMSRTYLNWARDNMRHNGLTGWQHKFEQADCLDWLSHCEQTFDLIFIDPPTFSNSKRMEDTFDVQRDHIDVMTMLKNILNPDGLIVFSNNKRHFKMDFAGLEAIGLVAENISVKTLPKDFARNPQIHNCWLIRHATTEHGQA